MCSIRDEVHITKGNCIMTDTIINVSSLSFGYAGSDGLVLEDITFDIKKGGGCADYRCFGKWKDYAS